MKEVTTVLLLLGVIVRSKSRGSLATPPCLGCRLNVGFGGLGLGYRLVIPVTVLTLFVRKLYSVS